MKRFTTVWTVAALLAASAATALAAPPQLGEGKGQVTLSWDEFVKITGYDPGRKGAQVLTIPWTEVEKLLGVEKIQRVGQGATVDLPWQEFKALLEWSLKRKDDPGARPPTDFIITSSQYAGALSANGATFTLSLKLDVLRKKGWKRIPILPGDVAITKSTLPKGVHLDSGRGTYDLLTEAAGPLALTVDFSVAVRASGGTNQVSFRRVTGGSSLVDLTVDRQDVDVQVAAAQSMVAKTVAGKKHFVAALAGGVAMSASWQRALPKVKPAPTKLYAETRTLAAVTEELLVCDEIVNFNILHSGVRELSLTVPPAASVLTVIGANLQDWRVDKGKLQVVLHRETIGNYALRLTYETPAKGAVQIPVIQPVGVERERGYVAVIAVASVEVSAAQVAGAAAIDVRRLPAEIVAMTNQPILLAFRYVGETFRLPLAIKRHEEVALLLTIADRAMFTSMQLPDGRRMTKVVYSVRNNRNQFLRLKMPARAEIWSVSVSGRSVAPAKDAKGNVLIPLVRSAAGARELTSFPAEVVYVSTPETAPPAAGKLHVELPTVADAPVMHVMFDYYLPPEGKYKVPGGLFSPGRSGFSGPLRVVEDFASVTAGGPQAQPAGGAAKVQRMQQQFRSHVDAEVRAGGGRPIHVRLPINGKRFKIEKILALPGDRLYFDLEYRGWKVAK